MIKLLPISKLKFCVYKIFFTILFFCFIGSAYTQPGNQWAFFNSPIDKIQCGDLDVTGQFITVEALVYSTGSSGWLVSKHIQPNDLNYLLSRQDAAITNSSITYKNTPICSDMNSRQNAFYHIAMTYDGQYIRHYINGILRSIIAQTGNMDQNNEMLTIGNIAYMNCPNPTDIQCSQPYKGYINEVRIWKEARTQAQIQQYMASSLPGTAPYNASFPNLLGYYRFNTLNNLATNGTSFNGTLVGGATIGNTLTWTGFPGTYNKTFDPTITPDQTICKGNSATLTVSSGASFDWDNGLGNAASQSVSPIVNTIYNVETTSSTGCVDQDQTTVTVTPVSVGGTATAAISPICEGSSTSTTLSGYTGTIRWQQSPDGSTGWADVTTGTGATAATYNTPALSSTTYYRARLKNGVCSTVSSNTVSVIVNPTSVGGIATATASPVCSGTATTITVSGHAGTIQWQQSANGTTGWANVTTGSGATATTYTTPALSSTTYYRAILKSGICPATNSTTASVTVNPITIGGAVKSNAIGCSGSNSGTLTLSGYTGNIIRWESSTDNYTTIKSISNTATTEIYNNLTATTQYRAVVKSGTCPAANSVAATITIDSISIGGVISANASVCSGSNSGMLTLSGYTGTIVRWENSINNFTNFTALANTTTTQAYTNLTATTKYRAVIKSGTCSSINSADATITVDPITVGGSVSGGTSVCSGNNSGTLTLSAYTGSVVRWESSIDNFTTVTSIPNTTITQTYNNLTSTTKYRVILKSGTCFTTKSASAMILVNALPTPAIAGNDQTICSSTSLLAGNNPSTGNGNWTLISGAGILTNSSLYNSTISGLGIGINVFRWSITNGVCPPSVSDVSITRNVCPITADFVGSSTSVCINNSTVTYTDASNGATGYTWIFGQDASPASANSVGPHVVSYSTSGAKTVSLKVTGPGGSDVNTKTSFVTVSENPTTSNAGISQNTCRDSYSLTGNNPAIGQGIWTLISGSGSFINDRLNSTEVNGLSLGINTFRWTIKNGGCPASQSDVNITLDSITVAGILRSDAIVCANNNSGTINLGKHIGTIKGWINSEDTFITTIQIPNILSSQSYLNLTKTTQYRAIVKSGTVCASDTSNIVTISVNPVSRAGALSGTTPVCSGNNSGSVFMGAHTGTIMGWLKSEDNFNTMGTILNTTSIQNFLNLTKTTQYKAIVKSGDICPEDTSVSITIIVDSASVAGILSGNTTVCSGHNSGNITLGNHTGKVTDWLVSNNNFTTYSSLTNSAGILNYLNLSKATEYKAIVKSGNVCQADTSNIVTIAVDSVSVGGSLTGNATVCAGSNTGQIKLGAHTGTIIGWISSDDNFISTNTLPNSTNIQNYQDLIKTTQYKAIVKSGNICQSDTSNMVIITVDPKSAAGTLSGNATVCSGNNSGSLILGAHEGVITGWLSSEDNFITSTFLVNNTNTLNYLNLTKLTQFKTIVTGRSCPSDTTLPVTIAINDPSVGGIVKAIPDSVCYNGSAQLTLTGYTGSIQWQESINGLSFTVVPGANAVSLQITNIVHATYYKAIVTNFNCPSQESSVITVNVRNAKDIKMNIKDTSICEGSSILLIANAGFKNYQWEDGSKQQFHLIKNPGTYSVTGIDKNGCNLKGSIAVAGCNIHFIPNIFTPNGDNVNEYFTILGLSPDSKLEIYNRWGSLIYSNDNYNNTWDGANVVDGTYYYIYYDKKRTYTGHVSIIR
jgi:gliding motility-associated-like protein